MSSIGGGPRDVPPPEPEIHPQQAPVDDDGNDTPHVSETFADDVLGAQLKKAEFDKEKQARDRRAEESRRRLANWQKVHEASTFGGAEGEAARKVLLKAAQKSGQEPAVQKAERETTALATANLESQQQEVAQIFGEIHALLEEIDKAGGLGKLAQAQQAASQAKLEGALAVLLKLTERLGQLEARVKGVLMTLLTGGFGFKLLSDPRLTFRRLFERLNGWPAHVPPGHQPESDQDFDAFISWIFSPPGDSEDIAEDLRLLK